MIPRFVNGRLLCRFLFPLAALSPEHCFARPFRSPAQAELTAKYQPPIRTGVKRLTFRHDDAA